MPTYLVHGFRWTRAMIRIHIILNDLEDAAAEWLLAPATSVCFLNSFYKKFDDFMPPCDVPPPSYQLPSVPHEKIIVQDPEGVGAPRLLAQSQTQTQGVKDTHNLRRIGSAAVLRGSNGSNGSGPLGFGGGLKVAASEANLRRPKTSNTAAPTMGSRSSQSSSNKTELGFGQRKVDFNDWSVVKLVEQYDPEDMAVSQPFAYVADHMVRINLSAGITEEIRKYELKIKGEKMLGASNGGSPVTVVERSNGVDGNTGSLAVGGAKKRRPDWFEKLRDGLEKDAEIGWYVVVCGDEERAAPSTSTSDFSYGSVGTDPQKTPTRRGLRGFFSRRKTVGKSSLDG